MSQFFFFPHALSPAKQSSLSSTTATSPLPFPVTAAAAAKSPLFSSLSSLFSLVLPLSDLPPPPSSALTCYRQRRRLHLLRFTPAYLWLPPPRLLCPPIITALPPPRWAFQIWSTQTRLLRHSLISPPQRINTQMWLPDPHGVDGGSKARKRRGRGEGGSVCLWTEKKDENVRRKGHVKSHFYP